MASLELTYNQKQIPLPLVCLAAVAQCRLAGHAIKLKHKVHPDPVLIGKQCYLKGELIIARYLQRLAMPCLDPLVSTHIEFFLQLKEKISSKQHLPNVSYELNAHLGARTFLCGHCDTIADYTVWKAINSNPRWIIIKKNNASNLPHLLRWFNFISQTPNMVCSIQAENSILKRRRATAKAKSKTGSFGIGLEGAKMGQVCTRFPPEPNGFLHIGHAKALLLNDYFAKHYKGKMLLRFDDTNPTKEKSEFVESITRDVNRLDVNYGNKITYTSDYFETIEKYAVVLIKKGLAYVDSTPANLTKIMRRNLEESADRNNSIEENLRRFEELKRATVVAQGIATDSDRAKPEGDRPTYALRAKIDMQSTNGTMRDPVLFRINLVPHHRTGTKYKAYPTYDLACPIVDSVEGVTHAMRSAEYSDRAVQYNWIIDALKLRKPRIWTFSRLNFVYTLLSKRKLMWFVENGKVEGYDDPRFPTIQGMLRRGLTVPALRSFILSLGATVNLNMMTWDKLWTINKKMIDPKAPRYTAVRKKNKCLLEILDDIKPCTKSLPLHPKDATIGKKSVMFGKQIFIEQDDALAISNGKLQEVTLIGWGNVQIKDISSLDGVITKITATLHLEGSVKKTKLKVTWVGDEEKKLIPIKMLEFDHLITVEKLEDGQDFLQYLRPRTKFETPGVGEHALQKVKKGDIIQLQRRGFFIVDQISNADGQMVLFQIPSGKTNAMSALSSAKTDYEKQQK